MSSQAVIVIGAPRSGTSSVAQALQGLGVYLGRPEDLFTGDINNQDGYFENRQFAGIFAQVENAKNRFGHIVLPLPAEWETYPRMLELLDQFQKAILSQFDGYDVWGWKTPVSTAQIPFVERTLRHLEVEPSYVVCLRDPIESARSMENKFGVTLEVGLGIWLYYTLEALVSTRGRRVTVIPFPRVVSEPRKWLEPVARGLSLAVNDHAWSGLHELFKPQLVRQPKADTKTAPAAIRRAYDLATRCLDSDQLNKGELDAEILEQYQDMRDWNDMIVQTNLPMHSLVVSHQGVSLHQNYRPNGGWQTFKFDLDVSPGTPVHVDFYFEPAQIWLATAQWKTNNGSERANISSSRHGVATKEGRYTRISVLPGDSQCTLSTPAKRGKATLELKFMVETNPILRNETVSRLVAMVQPRRS